MVNALQVLGEWFAGTDFLLKCSDREAILILLCPETLTACAPVCRIVRKPKNE